MPSPNIAIPAPKNGETGPIPWGYSLNSSLRYVAWQALRLGRMAANVVETGGKGSDVLTRVMVASGLR
jgi:hypothetical protein